ncbi:MAG: NrdH-redoxin [Methanomicrobia archaeon]|nr:NrdH-redoxin [Methanomicrobia archaeon]
MGIKVYATKVCPNCKVVKAFLAAEGEQVEEVDITTAEALTELRMAGVFTLITPVVQIGSRFFTSEVLFDGDVLRKDMLIAALKEEGGA